MVVEEEEEGVEDRQQVTCGPPVATALGFGCDACFEPFRGDNTVLYVKGL